MSSPYVSRISPSLLACVTRARLSGTRRRSGDSRRFEHLAGNLRISRFRRIGAERCGRRNAVHPAQSLQPLDLLARNQMFTAQDPRNETDRREMLDRLHLVIRRHHIFPARDRAVIGEQHAVMRLDVLPYGLRQLTGRRRAIRGNGNAAERGDHLGQHRTGQRDTGNGKTRRDWWMGVDHPIRIRPIAIDLEVHRQLGRGIALAGNLVAVIVHDHHHVGRHEPLRDTFSVWRSARRSSRRALMLPSFEAI